MCLSGRFVLVFGIVEYVTCCVEVDSVLVDTVCWPASSENNLKFTAIREVNSSDVLQPTRDLCIEIEVVAIIDLELIGCSVGIGGSWSCGLCVDEFLENSKRKKKKKR